jgi:hypothetical protein
MQSREFENLFEFDKSRSLFKNYRYLMATHTSHPKATPYTEIAPREVFKTEFLISTTNPDWKTFKLSGNHSNQTMLITVPNVGGIDAPLLMEVLDDDQNDLLGSFTTTLREMTFCKINNLFYLTQTKKKAK